MSFHPQKFTLSWVWEEAVAPGQLSNMGIGLCSRSLFLTCEISFLFLEYLYICIRLIVSQVFSYIMYLTVECIPTQLLLFGSTICTCVLFWSPSFMLKTLLNCLFILGSLFPLKNQKLKSQLQLQNVLIELFLWRHCDFSILTLFLL